MDLICNIACMSFLSFQIHQPEERCPILDINHDSCSGTRVPPFFTSCMRRGFLLMRASFVVIDHASDARARKGLSFYLSACRFPVFLCHSFLRNTNVLAHAQEDVLRMFGVRIKNVCYVAYLNFGCVSTPRTSTVPSSDHTTAPQHSMRSYQG